MLFTTLPPYYSVVCAHDPSSTPFLSHTYTHKPRSSQIRISRMNDKSCADAQNFNLPSMHRLRHPFSPNLRYTNCRCAHDPRSPLFYHTHTSHIRISRIGTVQFTVTPTHMKTSGSSWRIRKGLPAGFYCHPAGTGGGRTRIQPSQHLKCRSFLIQTGGGLILQHSKSFQRLGNILVHTS